jgi:hypothetical protein
MRKEVKRRNACLLTVYSSDRSRSVRHIINQSRVIFVGIWLGEQEKEKKSHHVSKYIQKKPLI